MPPSQTVQDNNRDVSIVHICVLSALSTTSVMYFFFFFNVVCAICSALQEFAFEITVNSLNLPVSDHFKQLRLR